MHKDDGYTLALKLYFDIYSATAKDESKKILIDIWNSSAEQEVKGKVAYFLGTICLTDVAKSAGILNKTEQFNEEQIAVKHEAFEWLAKSHSLKNQEATLLIAILHLPPEQFGLKLFPIVVEDKQIAKFSLKEDLPPMTNRKFASYTLQSIATTNKQAAAILQEFAIKYLNYIGCLISEDIIHKESIEEYDRGLNKFAAEEPMFIDDEDLFYQENIFIEWCSKYNRKNKRNSYLELIENTLPFVERNVAHALELMANLYAGTSHMCEFVANLYPKNLAIAAQLEQRLWQRRLRACDTAMQWLVNAIKLSCKKHPKILSAKVYHSYREYVQLRAEGNSHGDSLRIKNERARIVGERLRSRAVDQTDFALMSNPANPVVVYNRGMTILTIDKDPALAENYLLRAYGEFEKKEMLNTIEAANCHYGLALCYQMNEQYSEAVSAYDKALAIYHKKNQEGKFMEVLEKYALCLKYSGISADALFRQILGYFEIGNVAQTKVIASYIQKNSQDSEIRLKMATLLQNLDERYKVVKKPALP